jgi:hypothetical protein
MLKVGKPLLFEYYCCLFLGPYASKHPKPSCLARKRCTLLRRYAQSVCGRFLVDGRHHPLLLCRQDHLGPLLKWKARSPC